MLADNPALNEYITKLTPHTEPTQGQATLSRVQNLAAQRVTCPQCGSDWLFEIVLQQYRPGYSAGAGGDLQPISDAPQPVRMCPCGTVIGPNIGGMKGGRTPNVMLGSLMTALKGAAERRAVVPEMISKVSSLAASQEDLTALVERIAFLEAKMVELASAPAAIVEEMVKASASPAPQPAAEPVVPKHRGGRVSNAVLAARAKAKAEPKAPEVAQLEVKVDVEPTQEPTPDSDKLEPPT